MRCVVSTAHDTRAPCHARTGPCCQRADVAARLPGYLVAPGTSDWSGRWEIVRRKPVRCGRSAPAETAAAGRDRVLRLLSPFPLDCKVPPYLQFLYPLPVRQQRVLVEMRVRIERTQRETLARSQKTAE